MIRQNLDADSACADAAVHGSGLTWLQGREEKGAITREVQSAVCGPARVRIAKRGAYFYLWVAGPGEELHMAGGSMRVPLDDPFYVGIGVCSHDNTVIEKAVFSKVDLATGAPGGSPTLYSTLEMVPVSSGDPARRVCGRRAAGIATVDARWESAALQTGGPYGTDTGGGRRAGEGRRCRGGELAWRRKRMVVLCSTGSKLKKWLST